MPAGAELPEYIMDEVCPLCGGDGEIWDKESKDSDEPFARYLDA
jgi:rRNA maturation protein Nop10